MVVHVNDHVLHVHTRAVTANKVAERLHATGWYSQTRIDPFATLGPYWSAVTIAGE